MLDHGLATPTRMRKAVILASFVALSAFCRGELEFSGYIRIGSEAKFMITDEEAKISSGWITMGHSFMGYTVIAFDSQKEVLSLRKEGASLVLPLKLSHVKEGELPEMLRRGISPTDLAIRSDEHIQISLKLINTDRRIVTLLVHKEGGGTLFRNFDAKSLWPVARIMPQPMPVTWADELSDADIDNINRHLATVLPKWLPEQEPDQPVASPDTRTR